MQDLAARRKTKLSKLLLLFEKKVTTGLVRQ